MRQLSVRSLMSHNFTTDLGPFLNTETLLNTVKGRLRTGGADAWSPNLNAGRYMLYL